MTPSLLFQRADGSWVTDQRVILPAPAALESDARGSDVETAPEPLENWLAQALAAQAQMGAGV